MIASISASAEGRHAGEILLQPPPQAIAATVHVGLRRTDRDSDRPTDVLVAQIERIAKQHDGAAPR